MLMLIKPGAKLRGLRPEILVGLMCVQKVFEHFGFDFVITEATGGNHMQKSLHYQGLAVDIRSKHIQDRVTKAKVLFECQDALGEEFDFVFEDSGDQEHFHMEFDPE